MNKAWDGMRQTVTKDSSKEDSDDKKDDEEQEPALSL